MTFSIFTKRAPQLSSRLGALATYLNFSSVMAGMAVVGVAIAYPIQRFMGSTPSISLTTLISGALLTVSLYQISRGLMRRQRWAAYLAGATFALPVLRQIFVRNEMPSLSALIIPTIALCTIISVWNELGSVRDSDFDADGDEDEAPKRIRGFGEPRNLRPGTGSEFTRRAKVADQKSVQQSIHHAPSNSEH